MHFQCTIACDISLSSDETATTLIKETGTEVDIIMEDFSKVELE